MDDRIDFANTYNHASLSLRFPASGTENPIRAHCRTLYREVKEEWEARESAAAEFERRELDLPRRELELDRRKLSFLKRSSLTSRDRPSSTSEGVAAARLSSGILVGNSDDLLAPPALCQPNAPLPFPETSKSAELQESAGGPHYLLAMLRGMAFPMPLFFLLPLLVPIMLCIL